MDDIISLESVNQELKNQFDKWGEQNHDPFLWMTILMEEVGELSQAALHTRFGGREAGRMREEAVQVAAVAISIIRCLDRGKWQWPESHGEKDAFKNSKMQ